MATLRFPSWLALAPALLLVGCAPAHPTVLGQSLPDGGVKSIAAAQKEPVKSRLLLSGRIVEKCPQAGCWFDLRDETGTLRIDTKNAGFTVLELPLGTRVRVAGRMARAGSEAKLEATGLQY